MKLLNILLQQTEAAQALSTNTGTEKYFVVIAVIAVLFIGITAFLFTLDAKVRKLENK